ncbi:hypothetical protein Tco_0432360 [Tanacetum coccineum]
MSAGGGRLWRRLVVRLWWQQWWCEGGCGGVASVVRIYRGGDGSGCHRDAGGDDGGGFGCCRSWPEVAGNSPERRRKKGRGEVVARVIIKMK